VSQTLLPSADESAEISVGQLKAILDSGDPPIRLVDCREEDEWQLCRIEGAALTPLSNFADQISGWDVADLRAIIVYCHHGMRSLQATQFLRAKGHAQTFSLAGGIDAWSTKIDPTVSRY